MHRDVSIRIWILACVICNLCTVHVASAEDPDPGITVRVLNERGEPVQNARAAMFVYRSLKSGERQYRWSGVSDADGFARIPDGLSMVDHRPIYAYDAPSQTVAVTRLNPDGPWDPPPALTLSPACVVRGKLTCKDLEERDRPLEWYGAEIYYDNLRFLQQSLPPGCSFEFHLPSGNYKLYVNSYPYTHSVTKELKIAPGRGELIVDSIDLPATKLSLLVGQAAPELEDIADWKNSEPLRLSDLRGHPVVLDFWGQWCGPCLYKMPELMKLYDDYKSKGVVVVGVHVDVDKSGGQQLIGSTSALDKSLESIPAELWAGRDIPFPVAISKPRQVAYDERVADLAPSQTAADYGVVGFPTIFLIGPDGKVAGSFTGTADDFASLLKLLDSMLD